MFVPLWSCCSTAWHGSWGQPDPTSCGGDTEGGRSEPTPEDNPEGKKNDSWASWDCVEAKEETLFFFQKPAGSLCVFCSLFTKSSKTQIVSYLTFTSCMFQSALSPPTVIFVSFSPVSVTCVSLKLPPPGWFVPHCLLSSHDPRPLGGSAAFAHPGGRNTYIQCIFLFSTAAI